MVVVSSRDDPLVELGFEHAGLALVVTDAAGRVLHANEHFRQLLGWSAADDIDISTITPAEDHEWTRTYVGRIVRGDDDRFRTVKRYVRRDGSEFSATLTIRPLVRNDHCVGIIGAIQPVERRELVADPRVGKLLEHNASTITLVDSAGNVIETAGRYRTTLGYPPEFWEARTIFDILIPDDAARVVAMRDDVLSEPGCVVVGDFSVLDAGGTSHVLEVTAVNLLDDSDIEGIVITSRNVSEERAIRAELTALRDEAVAEADQRSRLVATVSHELRNPLHAVTGLSELLASDESLPTSLHELASTLHRQVTQLARVTDDLLDAAQLEIGAVGLRVGPTRVRQIVEDVARLGRAAKTGRQVTVRALVDDRVPPVIDTDGARLHQLLLNLVGNAVKFTAEGEVVISVACGEPAGDTLQLDVKVRDTGRGIPSTDVVRVFEPFQMAANAGGERGSGLGLAVASRIVNRLGGTIDVTSEVGQGSTFHISFPVTLSDAPVEIPNDPTASAGLSGSRVILVVEDNAVNQELARHQLTRLGAVGVVVGTAEEAIELAVSRPFDAILMDHQLPGMNGRDAAREMRRRGVTAPIVGVTASATAADERACIEAGMDAFLAKPVGLARLGSTLDAVVLRNPTDAAPSVPGDLVVGASAPAADAVDVVTLAELADDLGDAALVVTLVETFLGELDRRREAISGGDPERIAREAHTLKSSARLLGAIHLATACEQVEADPSRAHLVDGHATAAERTFRSWLDNQSGEDDR
jgi:PAS domain S-box-containing protein